MHEHAHYNNMYCMQMNQMRVYVVLVVCSVCTYVCVHGV